MVQIDSIKAAMIMKKTILIAVCAASFSACALPTYEPFTEYASLVAASSTNAIDLCTSGLTLPSGDSWGGLNYSGLGLLAAGSVGQDVLVTNNSSSPFTATALSSLLPTTFPGYPASAITVTAVNPSQPGAAANTVGNSAVLVFASDFTRPTSGTKTLYMSYLVSFAQKGQLGAGNDGRYLALLASSNCVEPSSAYPYWGNLFNTFGGSPRYAAHGLLDVSATSAYIAPCDCTAGKDFSTSIFQAPLGANSPSGAPVFVVGRYTFNAGGQDTNSMWANPSLSSFGGLTPPASSQNDVMPSGYNMSDLGGLCLIDRIGGGGLGGVGTNFIANLIVGTTWSYVTGGPEFTAQPATNVYVLDYGNNVSLSGVATAAGQSVNYQWQHVGTGVTNILTNGLVNPGGTAIVGGATSTNLTLTNVSAGDMGTYQLVATASGTGYTLTSLQSTVVYVTDPFINAPQPQPVTVNYGGNAAFAATAQTATSSMTYQWYNGTVLLTNGTQPDLSTINGASGAVSGNTMSTTLALTKVTYLERGNYTLWITNATGSTISSTPALLTVNDPYIVTQQSTSSVTKSYGTAVSNLTFVANGSSLTYQWYNQSGLVANAGDITGATTTNIQFSALTFADAGTYHAVAEGPGGSVTSAVVAITVLPITIEPPGAVTVSPGGTTNISVGVAGPGLSFQWQNTNGGSLSADFSGATTTNLVISNALSGDEGVYDLVVTYPNGTQTSTSVTLYVEQAALGPFPATNWPSTVQNTAQVTYAIFDPNAATDSPDLVANIPSSWLNTISLPASSGDQTWTTTTYDGLTGDTMTSTYFNPYDSAWTRFASYPIIDVLLQVYGDSSMYTSSNTSVNFEWTEGELWQGPYYSKHYTFPLGANNNQWNWILIEVTNPVDSTVDGSALVIPGDHLIGDPGNPSQGGTGGVNSGTIRMDGFNTTGSTFTVRAIAMGPQGVFGTTNEINRFVVPTNCASLPATNLVYVDFNKGISDNLSVNNNAAVEETYQTVTGGPAGDVRTAIQATSPFMELPILNNALGLPCNGDFTMQLCMEFYDDPNLAGEQFGPYAYATDPYGDIGFVPGYPDTYNQSFYTLTGSGQWLKVDWFVGPANLAGLNTAPLTGGPLIYWGLAGTPPLVDRIELGVIQTGTNALAGQIPDSSYNIDPFICSTNGNTNGYYAEWNPAAGVINNLSPSSGYGTTTTGSTSDQRTAEVPNSAGAASGAWYEQFSLNAGAFGPVLQDNSDVAMVVTYYDDPAIAGTELFVNSIESMQNGTVSAQSPSSGNYYINTAGTGQWVDAYFEVSGVNFSSAASITGTPNFVCKFASYNPIYISRVRYNVIRPCGQYEGIDYLQGIIGITQTNGGVALNWRGTATLQGSPVLTGAYPNIVTVTNTVTNNYPMPSTNNAEFFRLQFPNYPTNLSPYTPTP